MAKPEECCTAARQAIESLYEQTKKRKDLDSADVHLAIQEVMARARASRMRNTDDVKLITKRGLIKPRSS